MGIGAYSTDFLSIVQFGVFSAYIFRELSLKKIYNTYLNNIHMVFLRTIAIGTGASLNFILHYNLVRFGVYMVKLSRKNANFKMYPPQKN